MLVFLKNLLANLFEILELFQLQVKNSPGPILMS